jgi:hypothetical protein
MIVRQPKNLRTPALLEILLRCEISRSHDGENEDICLLGCCAVCSLVEMSHRPDDGGKKDPLEKSVNFYETRRRQDVQHAWEMSRDVRPILNFYRK